MWGLDAWNFSLLAVAGYVAVVSLVRLMQNRRESLLDELVAEAQREQELKRLESRRERRRQLREQIESQQRDSDAA